jgi:Caspase domain
MARNPEMAPDRGAGAFRVLLLGVPRYDDPGIDDLPFIVDDLRELGGAFGSAGYQVEAHDVGHTHRDAIGSAVESFFDRAVPRQTQVLYLSGHGVHYRGQDYLVPASASTLVDNFPDRCVLLNFGHIIEASRAGDVVVFVDACREGIHLREKATMNTAAWSRRRCERVRGRRVYYVYACGPGERARFTGGPEAFSVFSRALSLAVADSRGPVTLEGFRVSMQRTVDALTTEHRLPSQKVHVLSEDDPAECVLVARSVLHRAAASPLRPDRDDPDRDDPDRDDPDRDDPDRDDLDEAVTVVPERAAAELVALARILEELDSDLRLGAQLATEALDRFVEPAGLLALADADWLTDSGCGLRPWLADLEAAVRQGRAADAAIGARAWRRHADKATEVVKLLVEANSAPGRRYKELRSRLRMSTAKAGRLGLAEVASLPGLHVAALAALDEVPTDLDAAERRIAEYARALNSLTVPPARGAPKAADPGTAAVGRDSGSG